MKSRKINFNEPGTFRQLAKVLPLDTPFSILVDPGNLCNFKCSFCPTGYPNLLKQVARPSGMMDFGLFCKIVDDIQGFGKKLEKLNLFKDGEPFLNKNIVKMIAYAKNKNIAKNINITSNGFLINKSKAIEIIEVGLDSIRISVEHVTDAGYKKVTNTSVKYDQICKNVEFLYKSKEKRKSSLKIHAKILDSNLSHEEKRKFIKDFSNISDSININMIDGRNNAHGYNFVLKRGISSAADCANALPENKIKVCPEPFFEMAVNFNGLVSVCCADWSLNAIVGDVNKESMVDIWRGEKLRKFRIMHLKGERKKIKICNDCQVLNASPAESNLDVAAKKLLAVYEQAKSNN